MFVIPKIICEDINTWEESINNIYKELKEIIYRWVVEDSYEFEHMAYQGLCRRQSIIIYEFLYEELNKLTGENNKEWCQYIVDIITNSVDAALNALISIDKMKDCKAEEIAIIIYKMITIQLHEDNSNSGILDSIITYSI